MTSEHGTGEPDARFAAVLRSRRKRAGLTQAELAARAGIGVRTVRDLERGRVARPQRTTAVLLADALGLAGADRAEFLGAARGYTPPAPPVPGLTAGGTPQPPPVVRLPPAGELIGRDADVAELVAELSHPVPDGAATRTARPVAEGPGGITLVGLAGVGKTVLALVVAHEIAAAHPADVAGIVVTDGSTAGEILGGVAAVFGVGRPEDLPARLADRSAVLLVDAVERSPDAVADALSRLRDGVPHLRFLATGRHPVGLPDERVRTVAPLVAPPAEVGAAPGEAATYPAVALFLDRLARVGRTPLDADEVAAVVTLVRRLGGLPLAIELAAARGRVLTVAEILDRYGDRVLDLSRAAASPPETVVSLRDAVDASYRLLDPAERNALRRLAMFRHRWSLRLAEQMLADGPTAGTDVVHVLDRLLGLGLLSVRGTRSSRFRLLDVVRDFGTERAAVKGELSGFRRRHAAVLADLAQQVAPDLVGGDLAAAAARLDDVAGDLGAALTFAAGEDPHTALRIAAALPCWWRFRSREVTGRQWLRRLLDDPRTADADPAVRAWAHAGLAQLAPEHGAGPQERDAARAALAGFERLGDPAGQVTAHLLLAVPKPDAGGHAEARGHAEAALALARRHARLRDMAVAQHHLSWHDIRVGDLAAARRRLAEAERLTRRCGEYRLRAVALAALAELARLDGRTEDAERLGRRAVAELATVGPAAPNHRRRVLATIGLALVRAGRFAEAVAVREEWDSGPGPGPCGAGAELPGSGFPGAQAPSAEFSAALLDGALAAGRGERARAADCFARAADTVGAGMDPRDLVAALVGLVGSTPDPAVRRDAFARLTQLCRATGMTLLPWEREELRAAGSDPGSGGASSAREAPTADGPADPDVA
ncbi:putative ATPase [Krasilnikovia cinnamomea]|uniref:Putative ATPase n=1 Tax=Krasilnikovia cinnamomea TaxID=349313 RepID=A0A4Q7ZJC2_9ACTN|nr:helix-turn-helix domain-containing protein [Krasilnikovia cinnamomea]RZU50978.1 putative ATPase [Krasilnikovia cinnamomea]